MRLPIKKTALAILAITLSICLLLMFLWSNEPDAFEISRHAGSDLDRQTTGQTTVITLIRIAETLLNKPGGYLSNDVAPPGLFLDNIPAWEFGVITQIRDMARALRNDFSRSQTQSIEDPDLVVADPKFHFDTDSWLLPATESEYQKGIDALYAYLHRLQDAQENQASFYARADNLRDWLAIVEKRLGSLSQRLTASVGQTRINTDLPVDPNDTSLAKELQVKTAWLAIDNVFYEARGSCWALLQLLQAIQIDLQGVLDKKNARLSLQQIIRELQASQADLWSPVILNGTGFGLLANHSLVMASYVSRANAALIDLRKLLEQG